jgi:hypothetical protein
VAETVVANTSAQASGSGNIQFDIAAIYIPGGQDNQSADSDEKAAQTTGQAEKAMSPAKAMAAPVKRGTAVPNANATSPANVNAAQNRPLRPNQGMVH